MLFYAVIIISIIMYTVLDGFDLGVGMLHIFTKKDIDRRIFLNAIGPVWDGNEVWLVIIVGGTFAGFPTVYASILSSFYMFSVLLLAGLMFRAAAIEFRSKKPEVHWRKSWDLIFSLASYLVAFLIGLGLGNFIEGVPLDSNHEFMGEFFQFFKPYPIMIGLLAISLFMMHGAIYLAMKTEGDLHICVKRWVKNAFYFFLITYIGTSIFTFSEQSYMIERFYDHPMLLIIPGLLILSLINLFYRFHNGNDWLAFLSSCASIMLLMVLYAIGTFPYLVISSLDSDANSLTIYNSSSSKYTLGVLMTIVAIGMPLVLAYGYWVYRIFRGKVHIDETSY